MARPLPQARSFPFSAAYPHPPMDSCPTTAQATAPSPATGFVCPGVDLREWKAAQVGGQSIVLSENAKCVFLKRYCDHGPDGELTEDPQATILRVAWCVSGLQDSRDTGCGRNRSSGDRYCRECNERVKWFSTYVSLLSRRKFFPNTPTFTGAGRNGQLAACFVLKIVDDLGRHPQGIMSTLRDASLIQQSGGGNGFSFSALREEGAFVKSSSGTSTGPVGFMHVYNEAFGMIAQGGTRRGANMAVLRCDHPDIVKFITCKTVEKELSNFNISVGITDQFMLAVKSDDSFDLISPHTKQVKETVRARDLFDLIVKHARNNGEPGVLFLDTANRANPVPHLYELETTNPCGEQWLGPYENCCLGSINLALHVKRGDGGLGDPWVVDWSGLRCTVIEATQFLDDVVERNRYVPASVHEDGTVMPGVPQLKEAAFAVRRIGLGIMGLADLLIQCHAGYGRARGVVLAGQIMEFIRYYAMRASITMAMEKGAFPAIEGSMFDKDRIGKEGGFSPPTPAELALSACDELGWEWGDGFYRPSLEWYKLCADLKKYGIRNGCITTVAPTGTIATVAGCSGYGCEPIFSLGYVRHMNDNGNDVELYYLSEMFDLALAKAGIEVEERIRIKDAVEADSDGSCQRVEGLPQSIKDRFIIAADVTPPQHIAMQASLQAFVDNSISKTCNLPATATEEDVAECYMMAWENGCKGLTVYVTGSRSLVVLESAAEAKRKKDEAAAAEAGQSPQEAVDGRIVKCPRPETLSGSTQRILTPLGDVLITVNFHEGLPFEVIISASKAGSETSAITEAFGRLISYVLRTAPASCRLGHLRKLSSTLMGIGGQRRLGRATRGAPSVPHGIGAVLKDRLDCLLEASNAIEEEPRPGRDLRASTSATDDLGPAFIEVDDLPELEGAYVKQAFALCPDCGYPTLVHTEGCQRCTGEACGYELCT